MTQPSSKAMEERSCKTIGVVLGVIIAVGILAFLHSYASDFHNLTATITSNTASLKQFEAELHEEIKGIRSDLKALELSSVRTQSALDIVLRVSSCMHASM